MDLDTLFYIAIAVFYLLAQVLGGRKNKKPSPRPTSPPQKNRTTPARPNRSLPEPVASERPSELNDALREIRLALGWEQPEPAPAPPPDRTPEPASAPDLSPASEPIPKAKIESASTRQIPRSRIERTRPAASATSRGSSGAGAQTPTGATSWDSVTPRKKSEIIPPLLDKHSSSWLHSEKAQRDQLKVIQDRLKDRASAQDAFLMAEIFARRGRRL